MKLQTRKYLESDYDFIYNVKKSVFEKYVAENYGKWDESDQQNRFVEFIKVYGKDINIISIDGKDVGFYHYEKIDEDTIELVNICILKQYQGKGIGTKILKDFIENFKDKNIVLQYFKQNPVVKLYERLGFRKLEEKPFHIVMIREKSFD